MHPLYLLLTIYLVSCASVQSNQQPEDQIIYSKHNEHIEAQITVTLKGSRKVTCNEENVIEILVDGEHPENFMFQFKGCIVIHLSENSLSKNGRISFKPVCNSNTTNHDLLLLTINSDSSETLLCEIDLDSNM